MNRNIETFRIDWNSIAIEIRYEPHWLNVDIGYDTAHLEIESIAPERAHLPITETGYRSHFTSPESVAAYGGTVALVEAWLETESQARIDSTKPKLGQIEFIDKDIDHANRIVLANPVFQAFRKQCALTAIRTLDEAPHPILPQIARESYCENQ